MNPVNDIDLTPISFTFCQIMVTNMLPEGGYLNDVSNFGVYLLWMLVNRRLISLPFFILKHILGCGNQGRSRLPYV